MSRRLLHLAALAIGLVLPACGADAKDEAPAVGTADALALGAPNAVGADLDRPKASPAPTRVPPPSTKLHGKPPPSVAPSAPDPNPISTGTAPKKGTNL